MIHKTSLSLFSRGATTCGAAARGFAALMLVFGLVLAGCNTEPKDDDTKSNTGGDPNKVATPTADPAAGEVAGGTEITLTCATDDAEIYYTLDGSDPTKYKTKYSETNKPKITAANKTLKAIAVLEGKTDSDVLTAEYTIAPAKWVAVGNYATLASSSDGENWTVLARNSETLNPFALSSSNADVKGVAYGGAAGQKKWVAVGASYSGSKYTPKIATSTDGNTWTAIEQTVFTTGTSFSNPGESINAVAYDSTNNTWVAVGDKGKIATSPDGTTWVAATATGISTSDLTSVVCGGGRWFVNNYYTSTDQGATWTSATAPGQGGGPIGVAHNGSGLWLGLGYDNSASGWKSYTSPTGANDGWTAGGVFDSGLRPLNGVAFGGGTSWVIMGDDGKIASSTDNGAIWATMGGTVFGSTADIFGVAFGGGKYVAVGKSGRISTSTDRTTWTRATTSGAPLTSYDINAVAYGE